MPDPCGPASLAAGSSPAKDVDVDTLTKPSLASRIGTLAEAGTTVARAPDEASALLASLRQDYPEFHKFLEQRFARLPVAQQHAVLTLLDEASVPGDLLPLCQQWSRNAALAISVRARALALTEGAGGAPTTAESAALTQVAALLPRLRATDPAPLTDDGALVPAVHEAVEALPMALAFAVARELATDHPGVALALLRALRARSRGADAVTLTERLSDVALPESAAVLQDILAETTEKGLQKAVKKALHRLKTQGVVFTELALPKRTVLGTAAQRLERCLASFIDGAGDRILVFLRTRAAGGYHIAYLIINYGLGIRYALGVPASKRELPDILAKVQGPTTLIDIDPAYGQYQVALAQQMNLASRTPVPEEFFPLRDVVGEPPAPFDQALIYTALSEADLQAASTFDTYAKDLLELSEFGGWTLPATVIQKYGDALRDIEGSQIVVSQAIRQERINEVYERAMDEVLGEESRRLMRLRLEEMAYYLLQTERRREALWAVAAAQSLADDNPHRLRRNPFAGALLERSVQLAKERPSNRIILPYAQVPSGGGAEQPRLIV